MSQHVYALVGTNKGLFCYQSDIERREWQLRGPFLSGWEVYSVLGDSRHGPRIFAGTSHMAYGPALRVSDDFGKTWQQIEAGPHYPTESGFSLNRIWQIIAGHASEPDTLFAGAEEAGLFVSRDCGESWQELEGLTKHPTRPDWFRGAGGMCLHTILIDPTNAQRMWVAMSSVGVFRTEDGGVSWRTCNQGLGLADTGVLGTEVGYCIHKMAQDPADANTLYMQDHYGVFMSNDGADSWFTIQEGLPSGRLQNEMMAFGFPIAVSRRGDLFLVPLESSEQRTVRDGKLMVYRRARGEACWQAVGDAVPDELRHVSVLRDALTVDGLEQEGVYFGTTSGELFISLDQGESWKRLPGQLSRILTVKTWCVEA